MSISDITNKVNQLASNWEQFKITNDQRLKEVEHKGSPDPLTIAKIERLNAELDVQKANIDKLEASLLRPSISESEDNDVYKKAFNDYIIKGSDNALNNMEQKSLRGDNTNGYLVTNKMTTHLNKRLHELSPMRRLATTIQISGETLEVIEDQIHISAGWTEILEEIEDTTPTQLSKKVIPVHELYAQPLITQRVIDDAVIDVEMFINSNLIDVFSRVENSAFINGNGIGKPKGILSHRAGNEWGSIEQISTNDVKITTESLFNLFYSLKDIYAVNATFLMSRDAVQHIRMLKDTNSGKYMWQPGLLAGTPDTLLGSPIVECAEMPAMLPGNTPIAYGDFKRAYYIVDRQGVRILRDPFTHKPFVKFYATKRVGGDVVNYSAIKLLKITTPSVKA